jgi:hypothetical protein
MYRTTPGTAAGLAGTSRFCTFRMMSPRFRPAAAAGEFLLTSGTATPFSKNVSGTPWVATCRHWHTSYHTGSCHGQHVDLRDCYS